MKLCFSMPSVGIGPADRGTKGSTRIWTKGSTRIPGILSDGRYMVKLGFLCFPGSKNPVRTWKPRGGMRESAADGVRVATLGTIRALPTRFTHETGGKMSKLPSTRQTRPRRARSRTGMARVQISPVTGPRLPRRAMDCARGRKPGAGWGIPSGQTGRFRAGNE